VSASPYDLELIQRCLSRERQAWEALVDRSLRIVVQVVRHTGRSRGIAISPTDQEDLVAEVFLELCKDDFAALRRFQGSSSYSTYLTVIARRVIVRNLVKRPDLPVATAAWLADDLAGGQAGSGLAVPSVVDPGVGSGPLAEVTELLEQLSETEATLVRLHHLEGRSYAEISRQTGISENSIGPTLSRARDKMLAEYQRQDQTNAATVDPAVGGHRRVA